VQEQGILLRRRRRPHVAGRTHRQALGDAVNAKKAAGEAKPDLEVIDVAQLLVRSVRGDSRGRSDE
jgi:hypothetical protein